MKVAFTHETNLNRNKLEVIDKLEAALKLRFDNEFYGEDIQSFIIAIISVSPEFDFFFKIRRPRFIKHRIVKKYDPLLEINNHYSYDIKLPFNDFISISDTESLKMLIDIILESLTHFDKMPKKVEDFDAVKFKADLSEFLKNYTQES